MTRRQQNTRLLVCNNRPITIFSTTIKYTLLSVISLTRRRAAAALNDRPALGDTVRTGNQISVCLCDVTEPLTGNQNFWDLWHRTYWLSNSNYRLLVTPYLRVIEIFLNLCVCVCVTSLHQGPLTGNQFFFNF